MCYITPRTKEEGTKERNKDLGNPRIPKVLDQRQKER